MKKIMIEIGHGGKDPGACANGLIEKDENLKKGKKIREYLIENYEVEVKLSRDTDISLTPDERVKIVNDYNPDICISIHHNAFNGVARGIEVVHAHFDKDDDVLAADIVKRVSELGMPARRIFSELNSLGKDRLYMIRRIWDNNTDAILVECGFLDNAEDALLLKQASFVTAQVKAIAESIIRYMQLPLIKKVDVDATTKTVHWGDPFIAELKRLGLITSTHAGDESVEWGELAKVIVGMLDMIDRR